MTTTPTTANPNAHDNICNICGGLLWGAPQHTGQINCPGHHAPTTPCKKLTPMAELINRIKPLIGKYGIEADAMITTAIAEATSLLEAEREYASQQAPASTPPVSAREDGWVKVDDKLPEPHKCVVGWHSKQLMPVVCFIQNGIKSNYWSLVAGCFYTDGMETIQSVPGSITKWMPLPPPPSK